MTFSTKERREALKKRMQTSARDRDKKGLGRKSVIRVDTDRKINWYKPKSGRDKNLIDLIPFEVSQDWYKKLRSFSGRPTGVEIGQYDYKLEVPVHRNVGADNATFLCLREAFGQACPVCEERLAELDKKEDADEDKIKSLQSSWRCFYNVFDYNDEEKDFQLWEHSYHLFEKLMLEEAEVDEEGIILFSDLEDGRSIEFKGKEKKLGKSTFVEAQAIEFEKRDPYNEDDIKDVFPLDTMLVIPTYTDVENAFLGLEEPDGDGKETTKEESKGAGRTRRRRDGDEKEDDKDKDKDTGTRRRRGRTEEKKVEEEECPKGGEFGKDCNELDECADCADEIFELCAKMQDKLKDAKKKVKEDTKRGRGRTRRS
jgi:hypothetical protein